MSSGRNIMLSSEDARLDFVRFYPKSASRAHVVRFAIPAVAIQLDLRLSCESIRIARTVFFSTKPVLEA